MNTCKTAFYHLRNIAKIRNCLSQDNSETLVHAFISSKLDFCNALLYGLPQSVIDKLQYVQNCMRCSTGDQNSKLRTYNTSSSQTTLATSQTTNYVQNTTSYVQSTEWHAAKIYSRSPSVLFSQLRSSSKNLPVTPKSNLKFDGDRSFQVAAPRLWNSLTDDIRSIQNLDVFKNKIKTLLFREAFISQLPPFFSFIVYFFLS